jgi:hypothetical protein
MSDETTGSFEQSTDLWNDEAYNYQDFLAGLVSQLFDDETRPVPEHLMALSVEYLSQLGEVFVAPSQELQDSFWEYIQEVSIESGAADIWEIKEQFEQTILPNLTPLDVPDFSPAGVSGAISKIIASSKPKTWAETLVLLIKGLAKLKSFEPPKGDFIAWRRNGPFRLLATEQHRFHHRVPMSKLFKKTGNIYTYQIIDIPHTFTAPKNTDVVTASLEGYIYAVKRGAIELWDKAIKPPPGPRRASIRAEFNPLIAKSNQGKVFTSVIAPYLPDGDLSTLDLEFRVRVHLNFYSAVVDLN